MSRTYLLIEQRALTHSTIGVALLVIFLILLSAVSYGRLTKLARTSTELDLRLAALESVPVATPAPAVSSKQTTKRTRTAKHVTVTTYQSKPEQTDSTPHLNALNEPVGPGQCAVSRDLLKDGWTFGRRVYLQGLGVYKISDVMNKRFSARVDIWTGDNDKQDKQDKVLAVLITE